MESFHVCRLKIVCGAFVQMLSHWIKCMYFWTVHSYPFLLIKILNGFIIYFSLLVLADTQKLGLKQQLRNLEKQLNDLKVSSVLNVAESKPLWMSKHLCDDAVLLWVFMSELLWICKESMVRDLLCCVSLQREWKVPLSVQFGEFCYFLNFRHRGVTVWKVVCCYYCSPLYRKVYRFIDF